MLEENPLLPQDRALPEDVRLLVNDDNAGVVVTAADIKTVLERLGPCLSHPFLPCGHFPPSFVFCLLFLLLLVAYSSPFS